MAKTIADRFIWVVDRLAAASSDRLLEIGCGNGTAVEKMIHLAKRNNADHISAGKVSFVHAALHEADLGQSRFSKIFAVNVNLFWMNAARELEIIKERLLPEGAVYLFNYPPAAAKLRYITERMSLNLLNAGLEIKHIFIHDKNPGVCIVSAIKE
ncbi:methyltransferase domain-containing protein [Paenibacillus alkalitolerans]|uniref:class I SAM-dependent methyltransferase n=1 Tax=Paenibacillus alkalitolerans TaxID=2799335 RepID=UPI0018F6A554|nr:class I SAM-dependent methyltransferase [Paenibacillus alkalitolerans]